MMEAMRESWTDERLDDFREETARRSDALERRMDEGFNRIHDEIRALRTETRNEIGSLRTEMKSEIGGLHRLILQVGGGMVATLVVGFLGVVSTQL
jgi:hypothetical protein